MPGCSAIGTHDQTARARALDAHIGRGARQDRSRSRVHGKAELGGQGRQFAQARQQRGGDALRVVAWLPAGRHQDGGQGFLRRVRIDQAETAQRLDHGVVTGGLDTSQLQVGATGQVDDSRAEGLRQLAQPQRLFGRQSCQWRAHAHQQAIARHHRPMRTGAPAPGGGARTRRPRKAGGFRMRRGRDVRHGHRVHSTAAARNGGSLARMPPRSRSGR